MKDFLAFCFRLSQVAIGFATTIALIVMSVAIEIPVGEKTVAIESFGDRLSGIVFILFLAGIATGVARYVFMGDPNE